MGLRPTPLLRREDDGREGAISGRLARKATCVSPSGFTRTGVFAGKEGSLISRTLLANQGGRILKESGAAVDGEAGFAVFAVAEEGEAGDGEGVGAEVGLKDEEGVWGERAAYVALPLLVCILFALYCGGVLANAPFHGKF